MPQKKLLWGSLIGYLTVCGMGIVNHFLYAWSGNNPLIGLLTPVNESVWEHLKLLFIPYLLVMEVEYALYGKKTDGFLFSGTVGVLCGLLLIPLLFYGYEAWIGRDVPALDILIYFLSAGVAFLVRYNRIRRGKDSDSGKDSAAVMILLGILALFAGFTLYAPEAFLFRDPRGSYP